MPKKNILIIDGHPDGESYCNALADAYAKGVENSESVVTQLKIRDLKFNPNLQFGYRKRTELEPDLLEAQELIKKADHLVWVYPVWWGSLPAILKGFIDRTFLPGFAFKKREGSLWWDKFLSGKTSRIICTMDQPAWFYKWVNKAPSHTAMKKLTMNFVGVKSVKITAIGPVRLSKDEFRADWLKKVEQLGHKNK